MLLLLCQYLSIQSLPRKESLSQEQSVDLTRNCPTVSHLSSQEPEPAVSSVSRWPSCGHCPSSHLPSAVSRTQSGDYTAHLLLFFPCGNKLGPRKQVELKEWERTCPMGSSPEGRAQAPSFCLDGSWLHLPVTVGMPHRLRLPGPSRILCLVHSGHSAQHRGPGGWHGPCHNPLLADVSRQCLPR